MRHRQLLPQLQDKPVFRVQVDNGLVLDACCLRCIAQRAEILCVVAVGRREAGDHQHKASATDGMLQQRSKLGVTIRYMAQCIATAATAVIIAFTQCRNHPA
jgi:hypothetical protein